MILQNICWKVTAHGQKLQLKINYQTFMYYFLPKMAGALIQVPFLNHWITTTSLTFQWIKINWHCPNFTDYFIIIFLSRISYIEKRWIFMDQSLMYHVCCHRYLSIVTMLWKMGFHGWIKGCSWMMICLILHGDHVTEHECSSLNHGWCNERFSMDGNVVTKIVLKLPLSWMNVLWLPGYTVMI